LRGSHSWLPRPAATSKDPGSDLTRATPQYHGIVVDVNDPGIWMPGLGDLVGIGTGRQACPDVEELADSIVTQEPYRPHQELTVGARWAESPARS
jgi:hypothetical protein